MQPARLELASAIDSTEFLKPICPVVQNSVAKAVIDPVEIKQNLIDQLTAPVKWTQSVQQMIALGVTEYVECGPGKTLQGLIKKIDRSTEVSGVSFE
jgi:[acyl-carrier-protein] S-malonyltransferase